jgi:hypothetical protein
MRKEKKLAMAAPEIVDHELTATARSEDRVGVAESVDPTY